MVLYKEIVNICYKIVVPCMKELVDKKDELEDPIGDDSQIFKTLKNQWIVS